MISPLTHSQGMSGFKMLVEEGDFRKKTQQGADREFGKELEYCRVRETYGEGRLKKYWGLQRGPTR